MCSTTYLFDHFVFETWILPSVVIYFGVSKLGCETPGGGGGVLGLIFAGYVSLASQSPNPL